MLLLVHVYVYNFPKIHGVSLPPLTSVTHPQVQYLVSLFPLFSSLLVVARRDLCTTKFPGASLETEVFRII